MAWSSKTLAQAFPAQYAAAQALLTDAQAQLAALQPAEAAVAQLVSDANALVTAAQQQLDDLAGSGIYSIALAAGEGSWSTRLATSPDAPPRSSSVYTAIVASLFVGVDPVAVGNAYGSLKDSMTKPMRIETPSPGPLGPADKIDEGDAEWPDEDKWLTLTVGDLFPAQLVAANAAMNAAKKDLALAQNAQAAVTAKKAVLNEAVTASQSVVTAMGGTGTYELTLEPALGDWLARMTGEPGSPPTDSLSFCAGSVTVIQAADLATVQEKWAQLTGARG